MINSQHPILNDLKATSVLVMIVPEGSDGRLIFDGDYDWLPHNRYVNPVIYGLAAVFLVEGAATRR